MIEILQAVVVISGINVWTACFVKGFFPKQKRLNLLVTLTVVYGCFPLLVATALYLALFTSK